jgi:hypothetical protein
LQVCRELAWIDPTIHPIYRYFYPINALKPRISLEIRVRAVVPCLRIEVQHGFNQFFCSTIFEISGEFHVALNDALIDIVRVIGVSTEGQFSDHELEQHHSN